MTSQPTNIGRWGASEGVLGHLAALDAERRAHDDDDVYSSYSRRRKGPERPQPSAAHVGRLS
jgi:hypothetical protein